MEISASCEPQTEYCGSVGFSFPLPPLPDPQGKLHLGNFTDTESITNYFERQNVETGVDFN